MGRAERRLMRALADADAAGLSLDVFDTLVLRPVTPELLRFGAIARRQHRALRVHGLQSPGWIALWRARLVCHKAAYDRRRLTQAEPRHDAILAALCERLALPPQWAELLAGAELEYEIAIARGNAPLVRVLAGAGLPLVLTSDMYLPGWALSAIVAKACAPMADAVVLVSADHGTSKRAGPLFDVACARLGVAPALVLHVGDDVEADVEGARQRGMMALHWPRGWLWRLSSRGLDRLSRLVLRRLGWIG